MNYNTDLFAKLSDNTGYHKTNEQNVLNKYVNFMNYENTQQLADVLVQETIQMRGLEFYFIPREYVNLDQIFGEDLESKFTKAWKVAGYLESFDAYSGNNTFFSKFGMEVNDEINIIINPNLFKYQANNSEPKPGDLFYFKMDNSLFEVTWVEPYTPFYQVGQNSQRRIIAQKFVYSGEIINPELQYNEGIEIDELSALDLEPVSNLDQLADNNKSQYIESKQFNSEADQFVHPYEVINGRGSPFSDF